MYFGRRPLRGSMFPFVSLIETAEHFVTAVAAQHEPAETLNLFQDVKQREIGHIAQWLVLGIQTLVNFVIDSERMWPGHIQRKAYFSCRVTGVRFIVGERDEAAQGEGLGRTQRFVILIGKALAHHC